MPRVCTICNHTERAAINAALLDGTPYRHIAARYGTSTGALQRHKEEHLPVALVQAKEAEDIAEADDLLGQVRALQGRAMTILDKAEAAGDLRTALTAIREARGNLELLARLLGELQEGATINVLISPEWLSLRLVIVQALSAYPEAHRAVLGALSASGAEG